MDTVAHDEALARLNETLSDAVNGRGQVVTVIGTVGTGKSDLLRTFAELVIDAGALAIVGNGSRAERDLPFGLLQQLLRDAPLRPDERERVTDLLREGVRAAAPAGDETGQISPQAVHALCTVLLELSQRCPLVLVVDDVHHADQASLVCLTYIARRVRFAQLLVVFSYSDFDRSAENWLHTDLLRSPHGTRLRLGALSADEVRAFAAARVSAAAAERFAGDWYALSGGNALLVGGLLEDHAVAARRGEPDDVVVGDAYGRAVVSCMHRGEPRLLQIARGLAVLSDPGSVDRLLGIGSAAVSRAIRSLTAAGLLAEGRFRHPAARAAVLADIDGALLAEMHRRAAVLTYDRGAAPGVVAEHLLNASAIDEPWAVAVLEDAALQALRDDRVESGVAYLKLAWQACREETRRNTLMTMLLRAEWRINPAMSVGLLGQLTASMGRGHLGGNDAVVLAKALLWHGQFTDAKDVLAGLASTLDEDTMTEVAVSWYWLRCTYPEFPREDRAPFAPAASTVSASRHLRAAKALTDVLEHGPRDDTITTIERILHGTHLDELTLEAVESGLLALIYAGHAQQAAPWCDQFMEEAYTRRAPCWQARLAAVRAEIALRLGDLPSAADHARLALRVIPPSGWGVAVGGPLSTLVLATTAMGQFDEAQRWLAQPVPEAMFQTVYGPAYLRARGRFGLATGHAALALRDFQRCGELMRQWELDAPGLAPWRLDIAEARLALGQAERAMKIVEDQLNRSNGLIRVRGMALRLYAATSLPRHRPALLAEAGDLLQASGDHYELSRALGALAGAYDAMGESRRASMIGRRATKLARECQGVVGIAEPASPSESPQTARRSEVVTGPAALLSEAERRVAALAVAGYTNREISGKLFVTVSTVEQHLTRTYRKLKVTSRADLPASLDLGRLSEA